MHCRTVLKTYPSMLLAVPPSITVIAVYREVAETKPNQSWSLKLHWKFFPLTCWQAIKACMTRFGSTAIWTRQCVIHFYCSSVFWVCGWLQIKCNIFRWHRHSPPLPRDALPIFNLNPHTTCLLTVAAWTKPCSTSAQHMLVCSVLAHKKCAGASVY